MLRPSSSSPDGPPNIYVPSPPTFPRRAHLGIFRGIARRRTSRFAPLTAAAAEQRIILQRTFLDDPLETDPPVVEFFSLYPNPQTLLCLMIFYLHCFFITITFKNW